MDYMKKLYVKSVSDLEKDNKTPDCNLIGDLILYDLDNNLVYYVFNTTEILKQSKQSLSYLMSKNNYMTLAIKEAYPISEQKFEELLKIPGRNFYQMNKNEFLKDLELEELII